MRPSKDFRAGRWAKALYQALPEGDREGAALSLVALGEAVSSDAGIAAYARDPGASKKGLAEAFGSAVGASGPLLRILELLSKKGLLPFLPSLAAAYRDCLDGAAGRISAEVVSASPMDEATLRAIAGKAAAELGAKEARASLRVDPSLIAGFTIRSGSWFWDRSASSRIARMALAAGRPLSASVPADAGPAGDASH